MTKSEYEAGRREGKTEATLEGIAHTLDEMRDDIGLCHRRIDNLWTFLATSMVMMIMAIIGLYAMIRG